MKLFICPIASSVEQILDKIMMSRGSEGQIFSFRACTVVEICQVLLMDRRFSGDDRCLLCAVCPFDVYRSGKIGMHGKNPEDIAETSKGHID
ncbi:MAG: hypothetical protein GDA38_14885 [Hormoscilla sp. SP12CHS1]|nr:hypothetical protein [Hormoscilla sp. SP12CHS1]